MQTKVTYVEFTKQNIFRKKVYSTIILEGKNGTMHSREKCYSMKVWILLNTASGLWFLLTLGSIIF